MKTFPKATCAPPAFHTCHMSCILTCTDQQTNRYANCWTEGTFALCQAKLTTTIANILPGLFLVLFAWQRLGLNMMKR